MPKKKLRFTLGETLDKLPGEITRNKLSVESKVRPATIADLVNGEAKRIEVDTLQKILEALERLADGTMRITVEDVIKYE